MSLKEEQDWLYDMYSEKKDDLYEDIRSVVLQAKDSTVKLKGREWNYINLCGEVAKRRFTEMYIDADNECIVKFVDEDGEFEFELWHLSIDEMYFLIEDMVVEDD